MLRPILVVQAALALFSIVNAVPVALVARQQVAETQLQTVQTTQTNQGFMTQTCTITLTPITVNGNPAVQEVQTCTVSMGGGGENSGNPSAPSSSTNTGGSSDGHGEAGVVNSVTSVPASFTQTSSAETGSETSAASGSSESTTSAASASSGSAAHGGAAGVVDGVSSVAASAFGSDLAAPTGTPTATGITPGATVTPAAANAAVSTTAASQAFALPGKKLQVLPIGLGVFAGISVIALIVVGLVTYERTKYRKAFRQRKLAEAGSAMGYGGMAQRT